MEHKFTVVIEPKDDTEERIFVKSSLQEWLDANCGKSSFKDWKSAEVE